MFADPKAEDVVADDEKGVKANENVVQKVESIFKKQHRAAGKLTLSERKFVGEKVVDQNELCNEKVHLEPKELSAAPEREKKRVRLTVCLKPEEGREKKKKVPRGGSSNDMEVEQQVSHLRRNVVEM